MNNFTFHNPTKIVFGKGAIERLPKLLPEQATILLAYGGGSIQRNGIYDTVVSLLKGYKVVPFGGIEANPDVATLKEAIALGKREGVTFVLAVGGGSVIDGSKLIAAGILSPKDPWQIVLEHKVDKALPLASVLTVPATGSEMNAGAVISNRATQEKFSFQGYHPVFSILDPTYAYTLSYHQIACGIADSFVHVCEQYLTYPGQSALMDRMAEGVLLNIIDIAKDQQKLKERDYATYCEYMLSATFALNGFVGMGVEQDWLTHMIGHEITALTDTTHGASLAMLYPAVLRVLIQEKGAKIAQMGRRIWRLENHNEETLIRQTIECIAEFFRSLGLAASLAEAHIQPEIAQEITQRIERRGIVFGEKGLGTPQVVQSILKEAYKI